MSSPGMTREPTYDPFILLKAQALTRHAINVLQRYRFPVKSNTVQRQSSHTVIFVLQ